MAKKKGKMSPGRVAERKMTDAVAFGKAKEVVLPDGRTAVVDPSKPKGSRIIGYMGKSRK